ncbi:MAG: metallophosphoesterase [Synergistaceae bacterium]|nr:metallophosphoesterase [Synergistaceae bacterium]
MIHGVLIFLTATNVYLYWKLRSGFGGGSLIGWNGIYLIWALGGVVLPFVSRSGLLGSGRASEILFALSFTWVAIVGMACMVFLTVDVASLVAHLVDWALGTSSRRFFAPRKCVPATLILVAMMALYSFYEAWTVRRVDLTLETTKLPEGMERLRLAHLTDIHIGGVYTVGRLRKVMDIVRSAKPDLLVMTGDLVDGDMRFRQEEEKLLSTHGARFGAFAVTGNHDFYSGIEQAETFTRRAGFSLLRDEQTEVAGIVIIGLDDPARFGRGVFDPGHFPENLKFPDDKFVLLLKHRPQVPDGIEGKFDLQLSGHTHGGQIWPFGYVAKWINKHVQHLSYRGDSAIYISNGAGFWGPPLRFLTPPEVTVVDLLQKPK